MKAKRAKEAARLEEIPNVGPSIAENLREIGIRTPSQLKGKDGLKLYYKLNKVSGMRHDPCVADTFIAAVDFMNGAEARPWWHYTEERKRKLKSPA